MKIAVMGAGAVGCYYGGMLARAGHDVVLIGRAKHVDAIRQHGLRFDTATFSGTIGLAADTEASAAGGADLILCCVKSGDTVEAGGLLAPYLESSATVLSLQNGVDNAARLSAILGAEVLPAVVYVAAEMAGAGHVRHHGRGELLIGVSPAADALRQLFCGAAVPVEVSDNIMGALWVKLLINCVLNALSAISQLPYGPLIEGEGIEQVMRDALTEGEAVARAEGVVISDDVWAAVQAIVRGVPTQRSSTAQDLQRGKPSEIDHLNGFIVRRGDCLGVATPVNRVLHALVRLQERKVLPPA